MIYSRRLFAVSTCLLNAFVCDLGG